MFPTIFQTNFITGIWNKKICLIWYDFIFSGSGRKIGGHQRVSDQSPWSMVSSPWPQCLLQCISFSRNWRPQQELQQSPGTSMTTVLWVSLIIMISGTSCQLVDSSISSCSFSLLKTTTGLRKDTRSQYSRNVFYCLNLFCIRKIFMCQNVS